METITSPSLSCSKVIAFSPLEQELAVVKGILQVEGGGEEIGKAVVSLDMDVSNVKKEKIAAVSGNQLSLHSLSCGNGCPPSRKCTTTTPSPSAATLLCFNHVNLCKPAEYKRAVGSASLYMSSQTQKAACSYLLHSPGVESSVVTVVEQQNKMENALPKPPTAPGPAALSVSVAISTANTPSQDLKRRIGGQFCLEDGEVSLKPGEGTSTFAQATFNCTSLLLGLGVLSSPYAIAQTGWLGAVICLVVAGTYGYAAELLVRCQQSTGCATYQELAKVAVGPKTRLLIESLFYIEIVGSLLGYCISVADNMGQIFPAASIALPGLSSRNVLLLVACLCVLPTVWLRDLSGLSFTSLWSLTATMLLVVTVLLSATVADHIGFHHSIRLAGIRGAPIAVGLYAFAFSGSTVFPSIYTSMKDPSRFTQVLVLSFTISTVVVFVLGVAGASMFGAATQSQVTLSMPSHRITTKIVLWTTVLTPLLKFALALSPVSQAMDERLEKHFNQYSARTQLCITTLSRSCVLALIVIVAMLLPYFNYIISLIGSAVTIAICLIFPCIFYVKLCRHRLTRTSFALILITTTISTVAAVCGTILSFQGIVDIKKHSKS